MRGVRDGALPENNSNEGASMKTRLLLAMVGAAFDSVPRTSDWASTQVGE